MLSAARAALLGLAALGCDPPPSAPANAGEMTVALTLPGGTSLASASYAVFSSAGAILAAGMIDTRDPNAGLSVDVALPAGPRDTVTMTAVTGTGATCQGTSAPFDIASGRTTAVQLTLVCGGAPTSGTGQVQITATVQDVRCPTITSAVLAPAQVSQGSSVLVSVSASAPTGDVLTYSWSPAANFAPPNQASTLYACTQPGATILTLVVTDSSGGQPCSVTTTFPVDCLPTE